MTANVKTTGLQVEPSTTPNHQSDSGKDRHSRGQPVRVAGLCSTCIHSGDCTLNSTPQEPILFCEEFDSRLVSAGESSVGSNQPTENKKHNPDTVRHTEGHAGLCINCVHRDTCRLPRSEGGVWYCEEYE